MFLQTTGLWSSIQQHIQQGGEFYCCWYKRPIIREVNGWARDHTSFPNTVKKCVSVNHLNAISYIKQPQISRCIKNKRIPGKAAINPQQTFERPTPHQLLLILVCLEEKPNYLPGEHGSGKLMVPSFEVPWCTSVFLTLCLAVWAKFCSGVMMSSSSSPVQGNEGLHGFHVSNTSLPTHTYIYECVALSNKKKKKSCSPLPNAPKINCVRGLTECLPFQSGSSL